jgi:hypothetical protein
MAKRVNAAMFAKKMLRQFRIESIERQVILTLQLPELIRRRIAE